MKHLQISDFQRLASLEMDFPNVLFGERLIVLCEFVLCELRNLYFAN